MITSVITKPVSREAQLSRELGSIPTVFNSRKRSEKRVLVDGRWQRVDAEAHAMRSLLFGSVQSSADLRNEIPALEAAKRALGLRVAFNPLLAQ